MTVIKLIIFKCSDNTLLVHFTMQDAKMGRGVEVVTPPPLNCGKTGSTPLTLRKKNIINSSHRTNLIVLLKKILKVDLFGVFFFLNTPFFYRLRKNANKLPFFKIGPGSDINLGYLCNPPKMCRVWSPCHRVCRRTRYPRYILLLSTLGIFCHLVLFVNCA